MEDNFSRHILSTMQKHVCSLWRKKLVMKICKPFKDERLVLCVFGLMTGQHPTLGMQEDILECLPWDTARSLLNDDLVMEKVDISPYQSWKKNFYSTFKKFRDSNLNISIDDASSWKKIQDICRGHIQSRENVEDGADIQEMNQGHRQQSQVIHEMDRQTDVHEEKEMNEKIIPEEEEEEGDEEFDEEIIPERAVRKQKKRKRKITVKTRKRNSRPKTTEIEQVRENELTEEEERNQLIENEKRTYPDSGFRRHKKVRNTRDIEEPVEMEELLDNPIDEKEHNREEPIGMEEELEYQHGEEESVEQVQEKEFDLNDSDQIINLLMDHMVEFLTFASTRGTEFKEFKNMILWAYLKRKHKIVNY